MPTAEAPAGTFRFEWGIRALSPWSKSALLSHDRLSSLTTVRSWLVGECRGSRVGPDLTFAGMGLGLDSYVVAGQSERMNRGISATGANPVCPTGWRPIAARP